jgi:hypothetical protein
MLSCADILWVRGVRCGGECGCGVFRVTSVSLGGATLEDYALLIIDTWCICVLCVLRHLFGLLSNCVGIVNK